MGRFSKAIQSDFLNNSLPNCKMVAIGIKPEVDRVKIRWKHDSLRLRITPTELEDLLGGEKVSERFDLSDGLVWEVVICPNAEETGLRNFGPVVHLLLSREDQEKLAVPETEGVYFTTNRPDRGLIRYFIEKDFPCIHPRAADTLESPSETFAPPPGFVSKEHQ